MLQHRGYRGHVEFDDEARIFNGEVIDLRDVVTFQGKSVEELEEAFQDSVDDYLEFCGARSLTVRYPVSCCSACQRFARSRRLKTRDKLVPKLPRKR